MREALHAELLEPLVGHVEVLESPADLLTRERLVPELRHRRADGLDGEHGVDDAAVVEHLADRLALARALALVVEDLEDVLMHLEAGAGRVERRPLVALRPVPRGDHVGVARRPPIADEVVHLEPDAGSLLDRDLVHDTPARHEDPIGVEPSHLEPGRLLLLARMVHGEQRQLEAVAPRQLLQRGVGLFAVGAVVMDVGDLLPFELVQAALLLPDVADHRGGLGPVRRGESEHPGKPPAVRLRGHAVTHGEHRDLVHGGLRDELIRDPRAVGIDDGGAAGLALQPLIALDALLGVVLGLALFPHELDAVDSAVAFVHESEIVEEADRDRNAARRVRPGPVHEEGQELLLALRQRGARERRGEQRRDQQATEALSDTHAILRSVECGCVDEPAQCGNGHRRSFSLESCHRRARPLGSTIKNKMMSAPNTMSWRCLASATGRSSPIELGTLVRRMGTSRMNAAPRNEPRMLPSPPMITMNRTRNDSAMSKASVSALPRYRNTSSAPATPQ